MNKRDNESIQWEFNIQARERYNSIERELTGNFEIIRSVYSFFMSSQEVTRAEFLSFAKEGIMCHKGVQAIEWIPRVANTERDAYEERINAEGNTNYRIYERDPRGNMVRAQERDEYFPVHYVEPFVGNETAFGYDLASEPLRLKALKEARDTGKITLTERIVLVQEKEEQYGFLAFLPIYRKNVPIDSVEERRENLLGFVLGVFRLKDIVEEALRYLEPQGVEFHIHDVSSPGESQFLYSHFSRVRKDSPKTKAQKSLGDRKGIEIFRTMDVVNRTWSIRFIAIPEFIAARTYWHALGFFIVCMTATLIVCVYLFINILKAEKIKELSLNLSSEIDQHTATEKKLIKTGHDLGERVKDLGCLYGLSRFIEAPDASLDNILEGLMGIIPPAWQYPSITCARLTLEDRVFQTENFKSTEWKQSADIIVQGKKYGSLDVCYLEEKPESSEGPFLTEERNLINELADKIGKTIAGKKAEDEQRLNHEKYQSFMDEATDSFALFDSELNFVDINENSLKYWPIGTRKEDIIGKNMADLLPNSKKSGRYDEFLEVIKTGEPFITTDVNPDPKFGENCFIIKAFKVGDGLGHIATDITARKESEDELKASHDAMKNMMEDMKVEQSKTEAMKLKADAAATAKSDFLNLISHELRTPLNAIINYADIGVEKYATAAQEKILKYFDNIKKSGSTLLTLVNNLLDLSKLEAGKMIFELVSADVWSLIVSFADEVAVIANQKDIRISCIEPQKRPEIVIDKNRIGQVLRNLLSNSIKFSPKGGAIDISLDEDALFVKVKISDNGIGIPDGQLDAVFDKFVQSEKSRDGSGGTGLGLSISKEIVEAHKGRIWAENNPEGGTIFQFTLSKNLREKKKLGEMLVDDGLISKEDLDSELKKQSGA